MKQKVTKTLSAFLSAVLLAGTVLPYSVQAEGDSPEQSTQQGTQEEQTSTSEAPEGYTPDNTFLEQNRIQTFDAGGEETPKVLLVEDVNPWNSTANQTVLGQLTEYDKVTTSEFMDVKLEDYGVVVFANDQPFETYENYLDFKEYLEQFARIGGVIVFGACDAGWADGELTGELPGGVTKNNHYERDNYIADATHPIVTGELTDGNALTDDDLKGHTYCSHISFNEDSLPPGTKIILRDSGKNEPTLIEYPLEDGRVIASGLTWEHNYVHANAFGKKALDDLYQYAIRISHIDVNELQTLKEWRLNRNSHSIIAADASSGNSDADMPGISDAVAEIDGREYTADDKGQIMYPGPYGEKKVTVRAEGYRTNSIYYNLKARNSQIFFMDKDKGDGRPYVVMASGKKGSGEYLDLRSQNLRFTEGKGTVLKLKLEADWGTHGQGTYQIYQEGNGAKGKTISFKNGEIEFAPGKEFHNTKNIKLMLKAADGTTSEAIELKIMIDKAVKVNEAEATALADGATQFDWLGNYPVKSKDEIFEKILTKDMSISSDLVPADISSERNEDGTVTYKIAIGFADGNGVKNILNSKSGEEDFKVESAWSTFKKEIKNYKSAGNPRQYWSKLEKKYGRDLHATKLRATGNVDVNVCGYGEITVDQNNSIIASEGGAIIEGGGKFVLGQTFLFGPVPVYYEFTGGINAEAGVRLEYQNTDNQGWTFGLGFNGFSLSLPDITLGGGVGVRNVATAGVEGNGKLSMKWLEDGKSNSGSLKLSGSVHIKVLFVADYKWPFYDTSVSLWGGSKNRMMLAGSLAESGGSNLSFVSRDYLEKATDWNGQNLAARTLAEGVNEQILQEGVMPDSMPAVHKVGDRLIMLFLRDVADRDEQNYTQLVYSVYDGATWSEPVPVWESDTADYFFDSKTVGDRLYVAWQKAGKQLDGKTPEEALDQAAESAEICFASWDSQTGTFKDQQYLTDNKKLDLYPSVAADEEHVSVVWAENSSNSVTGEEGTFTVYTKDMTKADSQAKKAAAAKDNLTEMSAGYTDGSLEIAAVAAGEDDQTRICAVRDGKLTAVDEGTNFAGLTFAEGAFLWTCEGDIRRYDPVADSAGSLDTGAYASSFRYLTNGSKTGIVYTEPVVADDEEGTFTGTALKAVMYENGQWSSEPVTIMVNQGDKVPFMDAVLLDDGSFAAVMNVADYTETGDLSRTALEFVVEKPDKALQLTFADVDKADPAAGTQTLYYSVKNNGDTAVSDLHLTVSGDSAVYADHQVDTVIPAGEEIMLTETLDVSGLQNASQLTVTVSTADEPDTSDNSQQVMTGQVDVNLTLDSYEKDNKVYFVVSASNNGMIPAQAAISMMEDSENGIVLDMKNIGTLGQGDTAEYPYIIDKSKVNFGEPGQKVYYFRLETKETDWNEEDNVCSFVVTQNKDDSGDLTGDYEQIEIIPPEKVMIREGDLSFESTDSESVTLHADVYPENASVTEVEWEAEDADIVSVEQDGTITPLREGSTTVRAVLTDTIMDEITVTVGKGQTGHVHELTQISAVPGTCCSEGNIEYWHCEGCGLNFADAQGTQILETVAVPADPQNHAGGTEIRGQVAATQEQEGYSGDVYCLGCGQMISQGKVIEKLSGTPDTDVDTDTVPETGKDQTAIQADKQQESKKETDQVRTGDSQSYGIYIIVMAACAVTAGVILRRKYKEKEK